jgi:hypothetical protein
MSWNSILASAILLIIGAAIGLVPAYVNERSKRLHALMTRWDTPLYDFCKEFTAAARQLLHLSRRYQRSTDKEEQAKKIDEQHWKLRTLTEQIHLLGDGPLQKAAVLVQHHAYAVREVGEGHEDQRLQDWDNVPAEERFRNALEAFYIAARTALGVRNPTDVAPRQVLPGDPWTKSAGPPPPPP